MDILNELPYKLAGKIYRSPMPYSRMFDPDRQVMSAYRQVGIEVVVVLAYWEEILQKAGVDLKEEYEQSGMDVIYQPAPDFGTPDPKPFRWALDQAWQTARQGRNVAVHCHAGLGRTGIFAACLAKGVLGLDGTQAFTWVRQYIPGAVENQDQIRFIEEFEYFTKED